MRHLGGSGNGGTTLEFLSTFLCRAPPLEMRRECREFFPDHAGKGSLLTRYEAEMGLFWMWADTCASSRVETGMSGNFVSCSKRVKYPLKFQRSGVIRLETSQRKWATSRLEGRTSWILSSCGRCSRLTPEPQGTSLLASGKASPHASCSGASRDSSPVDSGGKTLCGFRAGTRGFLSSADTDLGVL